MDQQSNCPGYPKNVDASDMQYFGRIIVQWDLVENASIYEIFRSNNFITGFEKISEVTGINTFTDFDVEYKSRIKRYFYRVRAVGDSSKSSFSTYAEGASSDIPDTPEDFYILVKPIIEYVWSEIDSRSFDFPMDITGHQGGEKDGDDNYISDYIHATMIQKFDDDSEPIPGCSIVLLDFHDFQWDGLHLTGQLNLDLDSVLMGTERGNISITGDYTAEVSFFIDIGPRWDGHSSEQGGYYTVQYNGITEDVDWIEPLAPIIVDIPVAINASDGKHTDMIEISWSRVAHTDYYKIFRATCPYCNYEMIGDNITQEEYIDTSVENQKEYFYKIKAIRDNTESHFSSWDKGYTAIDISQVLPAPALVNATDGSHYDRVVISWENVDGADSYNVYKSSSEDGSNPALLPVDISNNTCEDTGVTPGVKYYYLVKAFSHDSKESDFSTTDSGYAGIAPQIPDPPSWINATDGNFTDRVTVEWEYISNADTYRIFRSVSEEGSDYTLIADGITAEDTTCFYHDTETYLDTKYYYKIKSVTSDGESEYSSHDRGYSELTAEEFYWEVFTPASKYAKARIYERFPSPDVNDKADLYADNRGKMYFKVEIESIIPRKGRTTLDYQMVEDGDLDKTTNPPPNGLYGPGSGVDEGGIILNGKLTGIVNAKDGNGNQTGVIEVTGDYTATCTYHLELANKITSSGYTIVFYNNETVNVPYVNTD